MIYFVRPVGMDGPIKIGYSKNPKARLKNLACASPLALEIIQMIDGDIEDERLLHVHFARNRQHAEWFRPCDELLEIIETGVRPHFLVAGRVDDIGDDGQFALAHRRMLTKLRQAGGAPVHWSGLGRTYGSVRTTMGIIKRVLSAAGDKHGRVENVYGQGYRFVGGK